MHELNGKAAIVTGASRGIGEATARALAKAGVSVLLAARSAERTAEIAREIEGAGGRAIAHACDVADWAQVEAAVSACRDRFGSVDILVNNAGVIEPIGHLIDSDPAAWGHAADINFKGVYHGLRAALPVMAAQKSGVIVNISSGAATGALEGWSHYCASKAAALSLTKCADREAPEGVRVVGLSPGTVATEMQREIRASGLNPVSKIDWEDHIPADWPARAILWLCTPDAAEFRGNDVSLRDETIRQRAGLI